MKGFWLSSSLVLALLVAGALALIPLEAVGHGPDVPVVEVLEAPTPEPEVIPETPTPQEVSSCPQCIALAGSCDDPATDNGDPCSFRGSGCKCGYCGTEFGCFPP